MMSLSHIRSIRNRCRLLCESEQIFESRIGQSGLTFCRSSRIIDVVSKSLTEEIGHLMTTPHTQRQIDFANAKSVRDSIAECIADDCVQGTPVHPERLARYVASVAAYEAALRVIIEHNQAKLAAQL